jgi:4-diphosphocytidyl-2-C-methyl-D-erythritol kinase
MLDPLPISVWPAPAKLTTELRIVGRRPDGYHLIDAEMVSLSLHDLLSIRPIDPRSITPNTITVSGPFADGVPTDSGNLVDRALRLVGRRAAIHIDKQIPHGGGLGGGSADAAAVLRWAGLADLEAAGRLGADIPFCLVGGRARVTGIGDHVQPLAALPTTYTVIMPPLGVSTPLVYRAWDDLGGPRGQNGNDLEPAALVVEPQLERWKRLIAEHAGVTPQLAGSGSTWFLKGAYVSLVEELPGATVLIVTG